MATIKSYTDLEQSKKLAKILLIESADMYYLSGDECDICFGSGIYEEIADWLSNGTSRPADIPCWSLAALLDVLPILDNRSPVIPKTFDGKYRVVYHSTACERGIFTHDYDNPVDACVAMIEKLYDLNLLQL